MDVKGYQIKERDSLAWLVLPMYKRAYAQWGKQETGVDIPLLLALLFNCGYATKWIQPLFTCNINRMEMLSFGFGLLKISMDRWKKNWEELFNEEPPNIFDVEKQIEYQVRYLTHLAEKYKNLDNVLRAWAFGEDFVDFCLKNKVDWNRYSSVDTMATAYWMNKRVRKNSKMVKEVMDQISGYPSYIMAKREVEVKRLENFDMFLEKFANRMKDLESLDDDAMSKM